MQIKWLAAAMVRVAISVVFAGLFYTGWLAVFLAVFKSITGPVKAILWALAPVVTATGFATGIVIASRLIGARQEAFSHALAWSLFGCVLGAVSVVWFGPMLIVFGMFLLGTGSLALREMLQVRVEN